LDINIVAKAFDADRRSPRWNPNADVDHNGIVTLIDISIVAGRFGQHL
jgi:hypothetical protein